MMWSINAESLSFSDIKAMASASSVEEGGDVLMSSSGGTVSTLGGPCCVPAGGTGSGWGCWSVPWLVESMVVCFRGVGSKR